MRKASRDNEAHPFLSFFMVLVVSFYSCVSISGAGQSEIRVAQAQSDETSTAESFHRLNYPLDVKLMQAIEYGKYEQAEALLKEGANPNGMINGGWVDGRSRLPHVDSPLLYTIYKNDLPMASLMFNYGADPNQKNRDNTTAPLLYAAFRSNAGFIRLLHEHGADINIGNENGLTALLVSAGQYNSVGEGQLKEKPVSYNTLKYLIDSGADVNAADEDGHTALMSVSLKSRRSSRGIKLLLDNGARVEPIRIAGDSIGYSALTYAVFSQNEKNIRLLLDKGAKKDSYYYGARLFYAVKAKDSEKIWQYIDRGAELDMQRPLGDWHSIMWMAYTSGNKKVFGHMVDNGVFDLDVLANALHKKEQWYVSQLVQRGNLDKFDKDWGLRHILNAGNVDAMRTLVERGLDPNYLIKIEGATSNGKQVYETPLYMAARSADAEMIKALLELGADADKPSTGGTPLCALKLFGGEKDKIKNMPSIKLLIQHGVDKDQKCGY